MFVWVFPPDIDWYKGMVGCDLHQLLLLQFCLLKGRKLKLRDNGASTKEFRVAKGTH